MPTSSTTIPPDTSGIERSAQSSPSRSTAMIAPGRSALNADSPLPRRGIEASEAGSVPVLPLVKPIVALPESFEITTALRQSS